MIIHVMSKQNHYYLFDSLQELKSQIDINIPNEHGETPIMLALNEKNGLMIDRILREYKGILDFEVDYQQLHSKLTPNKQKQVLHPLMLAVKQQMLEVALRILSIMTKNH